MAHRWRVTKARFPADPTQPWMAYPGTSYTRAHRFTTWTDAYHYAYRRTRR